MTTALRGTCVSGHVTEYPIDSPFSLCEEEGGPRILWKCAHEGCGAKLAKYEDLTPRGELQDALDAWRGLTEEQREWFYSADVRAFRDPKPGLETMQAALRLLKAAGR